ncbi:MAG: hypothetical protein IPL12_16565 [Bacteroidetes bacterium]|nr:hypothetical protein [Bacteroidota bacterium]
MNAETIIRDEASKFSRVIEGYEHEYNGVNDFNSDLKTALYDYYDNLDKLIFLYEVAKQIDKAYESTY